MESAYYTKIKNLVAKEFGTDSFKQISFIGGCEFKEGLQSEIVMSIRNGVLKNVLNKYPFNTQTDDIELFYLEGDVNKIVLIMDYKELKYSEHILDVIKANIELSEYPDHEIIYNKWEWN